MSAPPRSGRPSSRNGSFANAGCDLRPPPPVVAHRRTPSVGQRPPLGAAVTTAQPQRSASTGKGKKSVAKPRAAPVSAAAKRAAAKGTSLRARMPYLRPTAAVEEAAAGPSVPLRSFSSSASSHVAAPWLKASYAAIPEALQQVKKLCNAAKDGGEREPAVLVSGGGRERRQSCSSGSRPSGLSIAKVSEVADDAAAVIHSIEVIQSMLFSSFQSAPSAEAFSPQSPHRDGGGSHFQRSKSCTSQLESPLISTSSGHFLSKKERRKAWALVLHKSAHTFPLLVNAARSPLATREPRVSATVLTFLYNLLRHMTGDRQRKAVLLCEKLGIIRTCTAVLQEQRRRLRFEAATPATRVACLRACEAAGLLFTLGNSFNAKLSAVFRLSQSLDCTLACAAATFGLLEVEFASFQQSLPLDVMAKSLHDRVVHYAESHSRRDAAKALRGFQARMQWSCTVFSHFVFTLFVFTSNAASAREVGTRGAELCATAIAMATYFLSQTAPVFLSAVVYHRPEDTLHPAVGPLLAIDQHRWAPAWAVKALRHVELMLLWCVALLHRLGSCDKAQASVCAVALRSHVPRGCLMALAPPPTGVTALTPRKECVHVILLLLSTLLETDRAGALTDMRDLGGLPALVASVLALSEPSAQQWHHYYVQLATMHGCLRLPAIAGTNACYVDQRVPAELRSRLPGSGSPVEAGGGSCGAASATASAQASPCAAALQLEGAAVAPAVLDAAASCGGSTGTPWLSPVEKAVGAEDGGAGAAAGAAVASPGAAQGLKDGLLLVDTEPALFSPELHSGGGVDARTALGEFSSAQLPCLSTEPPPPPTAAQWQGTASRVDSAGEDAHLRVPLRDVPEEERVRVLRHHIARLARLDEAACDGTANPHVHKVVFERAVGASAEVGLAERAAVVAAHDGLSFFADFESGNLQRAVEVAENEYDLVLSWDTATNSYTQWFNFGLRGFTPGKTYHFNILNMEKLGSTFNEGQKPLLLHVPETAPTTETDDTQGSRAAPPQWQRVGHHIFYFRNTYERPARAHLFPKDADAAPVTSVAAAATQPPPAPGASPLRSSGCSPAPRVSPSRTPPPPPPAFAKRRTPTATNTPPPPPSGAGASDDGDGAGRRQRNYFTVSFSVTMPAEGGGCVYLANCFPFTYTELRHHLAWLAASCLSGAALLQQSLCTTPGGLAVPLLTVTALHRRDTGEAYSAEEVRRRPIALLVARVHPGETNASWVMQGLLDALLVSPATAAWAALLCESFVFKIVPMLNADGVVMGNHRCSFAGADMNRDYLEPTATLNPTLYALKQLLRHWRQEEGRQTVVFADFHGHSRAKNFLVYGCTAETMRGIAAAARAGGKERKERRRKRQQVRVRQTSADAPLGPEKYIAALLQRVFPSFSLAQSSFAVTKDKVGSARVVLYDEFGVRMSYGFEATMVGGRLHVPELLLPLRGGADAACTLWREEVHYSPAVYRAMGEAFVRAFAVLAGEHLAAAADAEGGGAAAAAWKAQLDAEESADTIRALWAATAAAGAGRDAPNGRTEEPPGEVVKDCPGSPAATTAAAVNAVPPEPRAGPYAIATRSERRNGSATSTATAAHSEGSPAASPRAISAAGRLDALSYLFLTDQRGAVGQDGDEAADDDDDQRTVDGSEVSSAGEASDAEGKAARRGGPPQRTGGRGRGDGSEAGDRSPLSPRSDSGSDDHDWSAYNSSASSAGEDIGDERSSASSVDEDIPTNIFM